MPRFPVITLFASLLAISLVSAADYGLPKLHTIYPYTFAAPYSCNGNYQSSALFMSAYSQRRNAPELLYNGACGSELYFESSTAGDDFSLLSYARKTHARHCNWPFFSLQHFPRRAIGNIPLENITASVALNVRYLNPNLPTGQPFFTSIPATAGMTYSALLSKSDIRCENFFVLFVRLRPVI